MQIVTFYERQKIEYYRRLKMGIRTISGRLCRDPGVICREIKRNRDREGRYTPSRRNDGLIREPGRPTNENWKRMIASTTLFKEKL